MKWNLKPGTKVYRYGKLFGYVILLKSELLTTSVDDDTILIYRVDGGGWESPNNREEILISKRIQLLPIKDPHPTFWYIHGDENKRYKFSSIDILENE